MKKMIISGAIAAFVLIFVLILFLTFFDNSYDLKIELEIPNKNPVQIDENVAKVVENEILQIKQVKDLVIVSSFWGCNIYCKFKPFTHKNSATDKIQRRLDAIGYTRAKINDRYHLKYHYFVVIHSKDENYEDLKKEQDRILDKLLNAKISNDIRVLGLEQKADYIYFSTSILQNYNLDLKEIKEQIKNNDTQRDFILKNENKNLYSINTNSSFKNTKDLENIVLEYPNGGYLTKFKDVFEIKRQTKTPPLKKALYKDENAIVLAISRKFYYPKIFLKFILRNYDVEIINPNEKRKIEIYLSENSNSEASIDYAKKIQKEMLGPCLFFIGENPPKTSFWGDFDEIRPNRITGFIGRFEKINFPLKEEITLFPIKSSGVKYEIQEYKLKDYKIEKTDVTDSILASNDGLSGGYYYDKNDKIEIILKNKDDYIYSKKLKTALTLDSVIKSSFEAHYSLIARKNHRYILAKKFKNPSLLRGAALQIRYLLSL